MNKQMCTVCKNNFNIVETHLNSSNELFTFCSHCGAEEITNQEVELDDVQLSRIDDVYNAVFEMCKVLADNEDLEYNMNYLGPMTELVINTLLDDKVCDKIYFPGVITNEDGSQMIEQYYIRKEDDDNCGTGV